MTLDNIIDPEIHYNSKIYQGIVKAIQDTPVQTILEIGASAGLGSTQAIIQGVKSCGRDVRVASIEVSKGRFANLKQRYEQYHWFTPYNVSSLPITSFPPQSEIASFVPTNRQLQNNSVDTVLNWYNSDVSYILENDIYQFGIDKIKKDFGVETFDMVLIDGSEFLGNKEFEALPGAKVYILDDIFAYKNQYSHTALLSNPEYQLVFVDETRGGSSIFFRKDIVSLIK